ncbi:MAG TPA: hypothetical protein VFB04_16325 [Terriglobales bacterium]|nr:hypothetical protein [Terriglobales bacterium]
MDRKPLRCKLAAATVPVLILLLSACTRSNKPAATAETATARPKAGQTTEIVKLPPPTPQDVRDAVARAFAGALALTNQARPSYSVGDFNGDNSEDIAVLVRPNPARLAEINSSSANWVVWDPTRVPLPKPHQQLVRLAANPGQEHVRRGDLLLAIIHGLGPEGWRNPHAYQTFILRRVASRAPQTARLPYLLVLQPRGEDVLPEVGSLGMGYVYWIGTAYAWQPRTNVAAAQALPMKASKAGHPRG